MGEEKRHFLSRPKDCPHRHLCDIMGVTGKRRRSSSREFSEQTQPTPAPTQDEIESTMMKGRTILALLVVAAACLSMADANTRNLQQDGGNGYQSVQSLWFPRTPWGPFSVAVGNVPGFYSDSILNNVASEFGGGPFGGLLSQGISNTLGIAQEAATGGQSTLTVG